MAGSFRASQGLRFKALPQAGLPASLSAAELPDAALQDQKWFPEWDCPATAGNTVPYRLDSALPVDSLVSYPSSQKPLLDAQVGAKWFCRWRAMLCFLFIGYFPLCLSFLILAVLNYYKVRA